MPHNRAAPAGVVFPALDAPFRTTITTVTIDNLPTAGLLIVDAANVVGSVPDGWWRDRAGAAARLRDRLAAAVASNRSTGYASSPLRAMATRRSSP
jgi:hypothetical protein